MDETQKRELLCQKKTPRKIEMMLATLNILPIAEMDLNIVMADIKKAMEQREIFLSGKY